MIVKHGSAYIKSLDAEIGAQIIVLNLKNDGYCLMDCGYSNELNEYTAEAKLDFDLVKLKDELVPLKEKLKDIDFKKVNILLTHFHPDHIGELVNLDEVDIYCNLEAFKNYISMDEDSALKKMFIKKIFKIKNFNYVDVFAKKVKGTILNTYFNEVYELFEGKILVVKLPGHIADQVGYYYPEDNLLYVGDAIMTVEDLENQKIEDVLINVSENKNEANETLEKLIKIKKETKIKIVSAHYKVK